MKKAILVALTVIGLQSIAQTTPDTTRVPKAAQPPKAVTSKFTTDYPNITPAWDVAGSNYTATYSDMNTNTGRRVIYDRNGNILGTESEMSGTTYPVAISDYYTKNFPNEKYQVWSSQDNNGNVTYYSTRKSNVLWFDKDGQYKTTKPVKSTSGTKSTGSTTGTQK